MQDMNKNHRFFYQIQGQLNITERCYCIFAIWTPKSVKILRVSRDTDFWINNMEPLLTRFYNECLLPEILDSRHNRHMPIRNPDYILQAKEACKRKLSRDSIADNGSQHELVSRKSKRFQQNVLPITITDTQEALGQHEENDEVIFCGKFQLRKQTAEALQRKQILDDIIESISAVQSNVLSLESKLNDGALDLFLRVIRETTSFETQSVLYLVYPNEISASRSNKSLQIIGGNCTDHWRCIFYDGVVLRVYDSLPGCTYNKLHKNEKQYICRRYPAIKPREIIFEKVQVQPDCYCCDIFAAAFATTIALGRNPCEEKYSLDMKRMRQHFMLIVERRELQLFPSQ